jgi:pimeloyl-ACP methyl ester carboxylesterase
VDLAAFLERTGGIAPDLPGFGRTAKPKEFDYSLPGYADFLERFIEERALERFSLVVHDIGAITGLVFAQRIPERIERVVIANHAPLLRGYRWHRFARIWRAPVLGELFMAGTTGFSFKRSLRPSNVRGLPDDFIARAWVDFDRRTRGAVLRLYRSMPEELMAREGRNLGRISGPGLVVWSTEDPYVEAELAEFGPAYADALGGHAEIEVYDNAGHWLWLDRPEMIERVVSFLRPAP